MNKIRTAALVLACLLGAAGAMAQGNKSPKDKVDTARKEAATARGEIAAQRKWLQGKGLPPIAETRLNAVEAELNQRVEEFERAANAWQAQPSETNQRALDAVLQKHAGGKKTPALPAALPWGAPKSNKRMPAETKAAWFRQLTRDERVQFAQVGLSTVGGMRFSSLPVASEAPQDADLAETAEINLTPAIRAKAAELGGSPVNIANWVRSNLQFTPTWGALQTADAALRSLRGNAIDSATLTIALLRASGIPARYQFGTVDVPVGLAGNWLGGVSQPEAMLDLLLQGGIAARGISEAGQIKTIRMEHAWASAYVYWSPSRGARHGGAALTPPQHPSPNAALNAWIPIDASFKQHQISGGANLAELAPFNAQGLLDTARQGATCTAASARGINQSALGTHHGQFKAQAQQQLAAQGADLRVGQVLGGSALTTVEQPLLAGTLAFPTVLANAPISQLAAPLRWKVQLALLQGTQQIVALDRALPEVQGQRLTLSFVPETDADAQTLAALMRSDAASNGLPPRIAAYLVKLKAQLRLDDQVVDQGGSFTLGAPLTLRTKVQNPEDNAGSSEVTISAGEVHAWAVQGQAQSAAAAAQASQSLAGLRAALESAQAPAALTQSSQALQALAQTYQSSLDAKSRVYQRVAGVVEARLAGAVRASSRLETEEAFGVVLNVRPGGVGLHADRLGSAIASRGGSGSTGYTRQSLERASVEAHHLLDRAFGTSPLAQSALSGLGHAVAQGQTVWRADTATLAQVLGAIDADSTIRAQLEQGVANGMQALVAQSAVDIRERAGEALLPMDPMVLLDAGSGLAAYAVSSRNAPVVQLTAQRPGSSGWLGLADAQATRSLVLAATMALQQQLNTSQGLLGDLESTRWAAFAGQSELLDGLYQARLAEAATTSNACDWLISTLASQVATGLPATTRVNRPPVISSTPVGSGQAEATYSYSVSASDPDGDTLSFTLVAPPTGMTISGTGEIQWPRATPGQFAIAVRVSDGQAVAEQSYLLTVGAAGTLSVNVSLTPSLANPGQTVTLTVTAAASSGSVTRSATLDGNALALNAQGVAVFAAPAAGAHPVVATVSDGVSSVSRETVLTVRDAAAPPTGAVITAPASETELRGMVAIHGTATAEKFAHYRLLLRRAGQPVQPWQEIGRGLAPVVNGQLGELDATRYENGGYDLQLRVVDVNGAETNAEVQVELVGNLKLGQFRLSFADIRAESPGLPLMLTRTYDSTRRDVHGDFGWGWSASGNDISVRKNMMFGLNWVVTKEGFNNCLRPEGRRRISVSLPDGGFYRFDAKNVPECNFALVPQVAIEFTPIPGPTGGPAGRTGGGAQLKVIMDDIVEARGSQLFNAEGEIWNPKHFELTTEEGTKYLLREGAGIVSVTDPFGNKVTYGANGYQHSANLGLTFTRDAQGRITRATDPAGQNIVYAYNAAGELDNVTDRQGQVTRFTYGTVAGSTTPGTSGNADVQHLLASITDPRGQVVMSNQFDKYGRLTGTADASGQASRQEFDLAAGKQVVVDRRGNRTEYSFDADGNITQVRNALGEVTEFGYDANGNETSVKNAKGEVTTRSFDPVTGKQLSESNDLGHTTRTQYLTVGASYQRLNPLSTTDARGNTTQYKYEDGEFDTGKSKEPGAIPALLNEPLGRTTAIGIDLKGNLGALTIAGEKTTYAYDAQGRRIRETNGLNQLTTYGYDTNGNETSRTVSKQVNGQTVTFTTNRVYDAENRVTEETDALGGKRRTTYNAAGKLATQSDTLGRLTRYSYDANARLVKTEYPDGTSEATGYDAEGNEIAKTDRAGRTTRFTFDALNRLVRTDHPDGSFESTKYDAAGRVEATTDRRGKTATMEYDRAGRLTASTDASGLRTSQTYDENGNRTSVTVGGRTTSYEYDALNRLTKTTWPDGSVHTSVYRPDNRKERESDPRGVVTAYGYDAAGRLTSVSQSLSATTTATTSYGYDETGGKVRQVDALGRTTTWSIDGNGRVTARQIQDGSTERSQYDAEGNRLAKTTFAGEQLSFQYDADNRLTGQVVPAGSGSNAGVPAATVVYSYSPSGQLLLQQEQGATTLNGSQRYRYDADDRLLEVSNPNGTLGYALDAAGNILERSVSGGGTTKYEYDEAGRMTKVTAPDGKQARYSYDSAGRLERTERDLEPKDGQAQVLISYQRYDAADRTVAIAEVKRTGSTDQLLAGQALKRATGGEIRRIDTYRVGGTYDANTGEFGGAPARTQEFEYDGNARLTREKNTKAEGILDTSYEYDAAGNRKKKTVVTAAGTEITTYSYDAADRLTQESVSLGAGGTRVTTYTWDGNGNLASKIEPGKVTLYRFDPQNRLVDIRTGASVAEASAAAPIVSYGYDAGGNRIRRTTAQGNTAYVIDGSHAYAQVARESRGNESVGYVRGGQLIRQSGMGQELFPLHGHLGTSMGAVDASGVVVEQTNADAFGMLEMASGLKQAHLYTGEFWDQDSQLLSLRARWYDPGVGRFISADPFEGSKNDPRTLNRYSYGRGDPIANSDPSGLLDGNALSHLNALATMSALRATNAMSTTVIASGLLLRTAIYMVIGTMGAYHLIDFPTRQKLQECIDSAKSLEHKCRFEFPVFFVGDDYNEVRDHVAGALSDGKPNFLARQSPSHNRDWIEKYKGPGLPCTKAPLTECDEYPWAASMQGGKMNAKNVSLKSVNDSQNAGAGSQLSWFHRKCDIPKNRPEKTYKVIPIKGLDTGYVCGK